MLLDIILLIIPILYVLTYNLCGQALNRTGLETILLDLDTTPHYTHLTILLLLIIILKNTAFC
jgi:hypothetical protein